MNTKKVRVNRKNVPVKVPVNRNKNDQKVPVNVPVKKFQRTGFTGTFNVHGKKNTEPDCLHGSKEAYLIPY